MNQTEKDAIFQALERSDAELARVTEDLIYLLVNKGLILFTELPPVVQTKLLEREKMRERLGRSNVSILSDDDTL